ncbi:hypothetical protein HQ520_00760, partial [bacterium]|nr:hypothetical protein [bacterium]
SPTLVMHYPYAENPGDGVRIRRGRVTEEDPEESAWLFDRMDVYADVGEPYHLILTWPRQLGQPIGIEPAIGQVDERDSNVQFDIPDSDDGGTTFSVLFRSRRPDSDRRRDTVQPPQIEVRTEGSEGPLSVSRSGSGWVVRDPDKGLVLAVRHESNSEKPPEATRIDREVFLLDAGRR